MLLAEPLIPFARRVKLAGIVRINASLVVLVGQRLIDDLQGLMRAEVFANVGAAANEYVLTRTQAFDTTVRRVNLDARILSWTLDVLFRRNKTLAVRAGSAHARGRRFRCGEATFEPAFETFDHLLPIMSAKCSRTRTQNYHIRENA